MKNPTNILAIVDPTCEDQPAVQKAAVLAEKFKARLELFICDVDPSRKDGSHHGSSELSDAVAESRSRFLTERKAELEKFAIPLRRKGLNVTTECTLANPLHEGLLKKIAASNPDLVVKDTHHHSLIRRTFITNTDWHLLRSCRAPLLLVKPKRWAPHIKMLACLDPGHHADVSATFEQELLAWGAAFRTAFAGELDALNVFFPSALTLGSSASGMPTTDGAIAQEIIEIEHATKLTAVSSLTKPYGIDADHIHIPLGFPVETLPAEASNLNIDIAIMGVISRSGLKRIFIGSTAERVLDRLPCDVLIVKPLDFSTDLPF